MVSVKFENISKTYASGIEAVKNVSMSINDGELIILIGSCGSGKSSILRMIAGLEEKTTGEIFLCGESINYGLANKKVSVVYPKSALYPNMNIYENISFVLKLKHICPQVLKQRVLEISKILEIDNILYEMPENLNDIQKRKVILGRALVKQPEIIIFDDCMRGSEDEDFFEELIDLHKTTKKTMFLSMQNKEKAFSIENAKIIILKDGVIQQIGNRTELLTRPKNVFIASLFEAPSIEFENRVVIREGNYLLFKLIDGKDTINMRIENVNDKFLNKYIEKEVIVGQRKDKTYVFDKESERLILHV
jgi:ABC-type sugar transport system ATPase subunit